jgi:hypothetical protein
MSSVICIIVATLACAAAFGCGWYLRGLRASREDATAARINCTFMMAMRKGLEDSRLDELRHTLTAQARSNFKVWQSLGGHCSTPRHLKAFFAESVVDNKFFVEAQQEFAAHLA